MLDSDFKNGGIFGNSFWNESPEQLASYGGAGANAAPNADQAFIEWLQSKTPEGQSVVYLGNQYQGTGDVKSNDSVTETKPVTLESTDASQDAEGKSKTEKEETSTLEKTETETEMPSEEENDSNFEWITHLNDDDADTKDSDASKDETSQYPNGMTKEEFDAMYEYALGMSGKGENTENGIWGSFETLPLKIQELEEYKNTKNETKANAAREQLENAKEQLAALEEFITNYKDLYSPVKEKTKSDYERDMNEASESVLKTYADLFAATDQVDTIQEGFDHNNNQFTPGMNEYTDSYGNEFTTNISVSGDKVTIVTSVYSSDGEFGKSVIQTTNDYEGLEDALTKATESEKTIENNYNDLVKQYNDAKYSFENTKSVTKQDIMDAYAAGKLNPYQAAVALTKTDDHTISFKYDDILSNVDYDKFSGTVAGSRGDGTVGVDSFMSDITGPDITAGETEESPTSISKDITTAFKTLNEIASNVDAIDVNDDALEVDKQLSKSMTDLTNVGQSTFQSMVEDFLSTGGKLQDIRENEDLKKFSSDIFAIAQKIYDKTSAIEERTNSYGLGGLDEKSIKQSLGTITDKINQLTESMPTYYSPGSDMGGIGSSGVTLDKTQVKALADYTKSVQCTKDAAIALMKSAAFNGAVNVTGDKYSEAWKKEAAVKTVDNTKTMTKEQFLDKNTLKWTDYLAAGAKGTLGTMVAMLGGAVTAINPAIGIILMGAGSSAVGKAGLDISTKVARSKSTNEEVMFGTNKSDAVNVMNDVYNRSLESANFGDAKSVGTYTNGIGGALEVIAGFMSFIENPASAIVAIKEGVSNIKSAGSGGLSENTDTVIRNVYELGENIITWSNMNININDYMRTPDANLIAKGSDENVVSPSKGTSINPNYATYGEATSDNSSALDNKYSGYTEQAKNSNLAKDYNAGMEQETNEAVSDKYVKVFKVMLDKEPDYIRKVLIAIPKNHSEREW